MGHPHRRILLFAFSSCGHCVLPINVMRFCGIPAGRHRGRPYAESVAARQMIFVGPGSVPACAGDVKAKHVGSLSPRTRFVFAI